MTGDHDALDRAIDEVAREMTTGEPSHALRARVLDRIQRPGPSRRWRWQFAAGCAAIALIVYFVWPQPDVEHLPPAIQTRDVTPEQPASPPPPAQVAETSAPAEGGAARGPSRTRETAPLIAVDPGAPQIAALDELHQLTIAVAEPRDLDVPDLSVGEVTIAPLDPADKERR